MAELKNRMVKIKVSDWATKAVEGIYEALVKGVEAGMPVDVAEEIAKEVTKLVYRRAITVEDFRPKPVVLDGRRFPVNV
jgi:hypothetical protein